MFDFNYYYILYNTSKGSIWTNRIIVFLNFSCKRLCIQLYCELLQKSNKLLYVETQIEHPSHISSLWLLFSGFSESVTSPLVWWLEFHLPRKLPPTAGAAVNPLRDAWITKGGTCHNGRDCTSRLARTLILVNVLVRGTKLDGQWWQSPDYLVLINSGSHVSPHYGNRRADSAGDGMQSGYMWRIIAWKFTRHKSTF